MHPRSKAAFLALALTAAGAAAAEEVTVLWSREGCEMVLIEKPGPEYGVVLQLSSGNVQPGDKLEGDFAVIDQIRRVKHLGTGEEIMMRGVRYSSKRSYVLQVMPKWCKAPKE